MFDIGFGELLLVMVIGLVVLGPERLPVAVKTVASWIRTLRSLASTVQNELSQELKLQELQDSLKKVEKASLNNLSPELKASMDELKGAAEAMARSYTKPLNDLTAGVEENAVPHTPLADPEAEHDGVVAAERAAPAQDASANGRSEAERESVAGAPARAVALDKTPASDAALESRAPSADNAPPAPSTVVPSSQPRDDR